MDLNFVTPSSFESIWLKLSNDVAFSKSSLLSLMLRGSEMHVHIPFSLPHSSGRRGTLIGLHSAKLCPVTTRGLLLNIEPVKNTSNAREFLVQCNERNTIMAFDPQRDIPDLSGKVILVTGGESSTVCTALVLYHTSFMNLTSYPHQ